MLPFVDAMRRALRIDPTRRKSSRRGPKFRQANFEPLEQRCVLSANSFGAIGGVVFVDRTDNGLTADDQLVSGANVELYRDSGNGSFDGFDALQGRVVTRTDGSYRFPMLDAGTYFVVQTGLAGKVRRPDEAVKKVTIADATGNLIEAIDTFSAATQTVTAPPTADVASSDAALSSSSLGGVRELAAQLDSANGRIDVTANEFNVDSLFYSSTATADGRGTVTWDGDANNQLDETGLGGHDLTSNGAGTGFRISFKADLPGGQAVIRVYSDANNWSEAALDIPVATGVMSSDLPFANFATRAGAGADFTDVGAVQLEVVGVTALDVEIDRIDVIGPNTREANFANLEPLSLGNKVWFDANNNSTLDAGEIGIADVVLNLASFDSGTAIVTTTTAADGTYKFDDLLPGEYVVQVDLSNFASGGALQGLVSSGGATAVAPDPDNDIDNDDNGGPLGQSIAAKPVTLSSLGEPTNDGDGANGNRTVDFGFALFDLVLTKTDDSATPLPGETFTYTIDVRNDGPADAANVVVSDPLPTGVAVESAVASQGQAFVAVSDNFNGTPSYSVSAELGRLASGASASVEITVSVLDSYTGTLLNEARVSGQRDASDPSLVGPPFTEANLTNNVDDETTPVEAVIDLEIDKSDDIDPVAAGASLSYTLTVTNHGPSTATNVVVTDTLPDFVTFRAVDTEKGTASHRHGVVTARLGTLAPNETVDIHVDVDVHSDAYGVLLNEATVQGNETEIRTDNNTDEEPTVIISEYDLQIVKTAAPDPVRPGDQLTYTLVATNNGPSDSQDVLVVDTLPSEVTYQSATTTQGLVLGENNGFVSIEIGYMEVGQTETITIVTVVNRDVVRGFENVARIEGKQVTAPGDFEPTDTETNLDNNEDDAPTQVVLPDSTLRGAVYVDRNDDGVFDPNESGIANVLITLTGTDALGNSISMTTLTDAGGRYSFTGLLRGTYTITEGTPPARYKDGKDTPGIIVGSNEPLLLDVLDDVFADLALDGGVDGIEFNFGELAVARTKFDYL